MIEYDKSIAETINKNPELVSLLYDIDLLPEQIENRRDEVLMVAVVFAYRMGQRDQ